MSRIEKILQAMIDETSYDKAPQSRIEAILLAIKNNTQYSHLPHGRIEEILLAIKNNTSYDKEPMSRIEEILLAKLNSVEYKKPVQSKIEKLLLKWLYQDLYLTLKGVPPLTFTGNDQLLVDWTIYGNTINGESVGDRTANLFANLWKKGYIRADNGREEQIDGFICSGFFPVEYGQTYSISRNINFGYDNVRGYRDDGSFIGAGTDICDVSNPFPSSATNIGVFTVTNENVAFIRFNDSVNDLDMKYMIVDGAYTEQTMPSYEPYGYRVPVRVTDRNDTVKTNIYLPEQIKMVGDEAEYINYAEQKLHRVRKNLLQNTASSQTKNDVTFTVNSDGSVTCNGTANGGTALFGIPAITLPAGQYSINGCPVGGDENTTYKILIIANNEWLINDKGSGANFTLTETSTVSVRIAIYNGHTCDNLTFYPMIRKADIEDDTYEPYIENVDLDVTLPALPTLLDTNTLSVGTQVQPSNMEIIYTPKEPELKLMMKKIEVMKNEQRT